MDMEMGGDGRPSTTPCGREVSCSGGGSIPRDTRMLQRSPISNSNGVVVTRVVDNKLRELSLFCFLPRLGMFPGFVRLARSIRKTTKHSGDKV